MYSITVEPEFSGLDKHWSNKADCFGRIVVVVVVVVFVVVVDVTVVVVFVRVVVVVVVVAVAVVVFVVVLELIVVVDEVKVVNVDVEEVVVAASSARRLPISARNISTMGEHSSVKFREVGSTREAKLSAFSVSDAHAGHRASPARDAKTMATMTRIAVSNEPTPK